MDAGLWALLGTGLIAGAAVYRDRVQFRIAKEQLNATREARDIVKGNGRGNVIAMLNTVQDRQLAQGKTLLDLQTWQSAHTAAHTEAALHAAAGIKQAHQDSTDALEQARSQHEGTHDLNVNLTVQPPVTEAP